MTPNRRSCCICGKNEKEVILYPFPNPKIYKDIYFEWILAILSVATLSPNTIKKKCRVCELHFSRSQYYTVGCESTPKLKKDSIPIIGTMAQTTLHQSPRTPRKVIQVTNRGSTLTPKLRTPIRSPKSPSCNTQTSHGSSLKIMSPNTPKNSTPLKKTGKYTRRKLFIMEDISPQNEKGKKKRKYTRHKPPSGKRNRKKPVNGCPVETPLNGNVDSLLPLNDRWCKEIAEFKAVINEVPDKYCDICTKSCYAYQMRELENNRRSYLPEALKQKQILRLCHRCFTHVSSRKQTPPSKAYWNNLDPGKLPIELENLTQAEQTLLSRIVPFIKIVKLPGSYGQYGCKGQAVLFAKDIFEVTEKLPTLLPRSSTNPSIIVVTEKLETVNATKQFTISRDAVLAALRWLVENNPLYKDVTIDENVEINEGDFIKTVVPNRRDEDLVIGENFTKKYKKISDVSRILHASWNQADQRVFSSDTAGIQCCAMAVASILRATILSPELWTKNILDENLLMGDTLYKTVCSLVRSNEHAYPISQSGYLLMRNFDVVKEEISLFGRKYSIQFDDDAAIYGSVNDRANVGNIGMTLIQGLETLFNSHNTGVLISAGKSFGVLQWNSKYYFTDSHSCGPKGATASKGTACVIECDTIEELCRIAKRATGSRNIEYTIDFIEVTEIPTVAVLEQSLTHDAVLSMQQNDNCSQTNSNGLNHLNSLALEGIDNIPVQDEYQRCVVDETVPINESPENPIQVFLQTSVMLPIDAVQPCVEDELQVSEDINTILRKTKDNIVNEAHELKAEEFSWYYLFPYGCNGFKEQRPVKISPLDYYQFRILGRDLRFQRNDYLFYALSMYEYYRVQSTVAACGKKIKGKDGKVEDVHLYLRNLRGTASYWAAAKNELIGMIRCLGPPTYFLTFSSNDLHWMDMRKALLYADGRCNEDPNDLDIFETQRLIEKYPAVLSRHFTLRVKALLKFIKSNNDIFGGQVLDFWWRIEFQNRGSPHLHMVVWIKDHPAFDTPEGIEAIDRVCSCQIPEITSDLHEIVKKCQIHHHTATCQKNTSAYCRFYFPRPDNAKTRIIEHTSDEFIRSGGRICLLKRRPEEKWVNNYNPILLQLWGGNMDIQPCGSNEAIAFYVAKYITKEETVGIDSELGHAIKQIQLENSETSRKVFKICMRILKERQVSASECVYRLAHLPLRNSSRKCVFLNTRKPDTRYRVLKFDNFGKGSGFCDGIFERYEKRPATTADFDFDHMSLLEFAMLFKPYYKKSTEEFEENDDSDIDFDDPQINAQRKKPKFIVLKDNTKMVVRAIPAVIRVPYFSASENTENLYYSLLLQYMPYTTESELLEGFDSAKQAFISREEHLREISSYMNIYRERDKQLESAFSQMHAFDILENFDAPVDEEPEYIEIEEVVSSSDEDLNKALNVAQRDILIYITECIRKQLSGMDKETVRLFITGGAGTGKTFLLRTLKTQINKCYGKASVKVCALTGVAARLVAGNTIHSLLKLPVQKDGKITNLPLLTGNWLQVMRQQWKDVEFLFIDEISMVPYEMLAMIDSRLRQLKNQENSVFGGLHVILFGDLLQLPPVRGNAVFRQPPHHEPAINLWRLFSLCELSENMRQQGDQTFINILNALRIGEVTSEHMQILMSKVSPGMTGEFAMERALRIYPTKAQVDEHNSRVIELYQRKNVEMFTIKAQDKIVDATRKFDEKNLADITPTDIDKTGGLPKEITIFIGAKVMLRKNIDIRKGLVNGATGFIVEIVWPYFRQKQVYEEDVPKVRVDFGRDGIHVIEPTSQQFPAKFSFGTIERRTLPLILSWASTVHKMQGSTVDHAVIYLGSKVFAEGQAYVALSRVRSLEGLRIEELDCEKLTGQKPCNKDALVEMRRLRGEFGSR